MPATVEVRDARGRPAPGAVVRWGQVGWTAGLTGDDGRVTLTLPAEGRIRYPGAATLTARHPEHGWVEREITVAPGMAPVELRLSPGARLTGRVVDPQGAPVAEARVTVAREPGGPLPQASAESGVDGVFELAGLPPGPYRLRADAAGWPSWSSPESLALAEGQSRDVQVELEPGAVLTGRIEGLDPRELAAVRVRVLPQGPKRHIPIDAVVDHQGHYRVEGLPPGRSRVTAHLDHPQRSAEGEVSLAQRQRQAELDLVFEDGYTLSGVVRRQGDPVHATVRLEGPKSLEGSTDAAGGFRFSGLPAGEYRLEVAIGWVHRQSRDISIVTDREIVVEVDAVRVRGQLLGPYGDPAAGAAVLLVPVPVQDPHAPSGTTHPDGRFELSTVRPGTYRLSARLEDAALIETVEVGGEDVDLGILQLTEQGVVTLAPRSPAGPVAGRLHAIFLDGGGQVVQTMMATVGADGLVRLSGVVPAASSVVVRSYSHLGLAPAEVPIRPGDADAAPVPVTLLPMAHLELSVPFELGSSAQLTVAGPDGRAPLPERLLGPPSRPVPAGGLSLELPPGRWTLTLTAGDGRAWSAEVSLQPGGTAELALGEPLP